MCVRDFFSPSFAISGAFRSPARNEATRLETFVRQDVSSVPLCFFVFFNLISSRRFGRVRLCVQREPGKLLAFQLRKRPVSSRAAPFSFICLLFTLCSRLQSRLDKQNVCQW